MLTLPITKLYIDCVVSGWKINYAESEVSECHHPCEKLRDISITMTTIQQLSKMAGLVKKKCFGPLVKC